MELEGLRISSQQFWLSALVAGGMALAFILLLLWRVKPSQFLAMRWTLTLTAAVFWSLFSLGLVRAFWEDYYQYLYPQWLSSGGILIFVPLVYGLFAFAFHWLASRLPGKPLLTFCLLCGSESLLEHIGGISGLKILQVPLLQEASPTSILAFSFPEYIFYWCIVIGLAALLHSAWQRIRRPTAINEAKG